MPDRQLRNKQTLSCHEIPFGVKDYLPPDSFRIKDIEHTALQTFQQWGYSYVITPLLEYLPVYNNGDKGFEDDELVKVIERETGKTMVLRADFTPQLARIVSSKMRGRKALKLSYSGMVVQHDRNLGKKEIYQAGVELMNAAGISADAEIISIAIDILKKTDIGDFVISLSHAGFINTVLTDLDLREHTAAVIDLLIQKDYSSIDDMKVLTKQQRRKLALLFELYGEPADVLPRVKKTFSGKKYISSVNQLTGIIETIKKFDANNKFIIDLREMHSVDYHTGVVFQIFIQGYGEELVNGGRYDGFLKKYGYDIPATGFGINLSALSGMLPGQ